MVFTKVFLTNFSMCKLLLFLFSKIMKVFSLVLIYQFSLKTSTNEVLNIISFAEIFHNVFVHV